MGMIRTAITVFVIALVGLSCAAPAPTRYYQINTEPPVVKAERQYPFKVEVRNFRSPSRYMDQMVYRKSDYEVGFYESSQWVEPPAEMVRAAFINALKKAELFKAVDAVGAISTPDLLLQGSIVSFDQVVSKKGNMANCEIALELVPGPGGKPVWTYTAKSMVEQKEKGEFVLAMTAAVDQAISGTLEAMEKAESLQKLAAQESNPTPTPTPEIQ